MPDTWLISDPHFDHKNIIRYCNRPFESVGEMNEVILQNWREVVKPNDLAYLLGDIAYGRDSHPAWWWLRQLTGHILLVKGSHDNGLKAPYYRLLHIAGRDVLLVHNPADIPEWWMGWTIHGHLHDKAPFVDYAGRRVNVSVEVIGYRPVSVAGIAERIQGR